SAMQVRLETRELHEFEQLASAFKSTDSPPLNLHGHAVLSTSITGSTTDPQIRGQLTATDVRVHGSEWKSLRARFAATSKSASLDQVELLSAARGKITVSGGTELQKWGFEPSGKFHAKLNASNLDAKQLASLAGSTTPVSGVISVQAEAQGTQLAP